MNLNLLILACVLAFLAGKYIIPIFRYLNRNEKILDKSRTNLDTTNPNLMQNGGLIKKGMKMSVGTDGKRQIEETYSI